MEKFGIFELLDALSALAETPPKEGGESPENGEKRTPDASFAAPSYGETPLPAPQQKGNALASFLARHEAAKNRAKKP